MRKCTACACVSMSARAYGSPLLFLVGCAEAHKKSTSGTVKEAVQKEVEELLQQKRLTRRKMKPKAFR